MKMSLTYRDRLLFWGAVAGLVPVVAFCLGLWILAGRLSQDLSQELHTIQHQEAERLNSRLQELFTAMIRQKALDVATQLDLYLSKHPRPTLEELRRDPEFRQIVVQPLGQTGYTALIDGSTGITLVHRHPSLENVPLGLLARKSPQFAEIVKKQQGGKYAGGFYNWQEPNGQTRTKYVFFAPSKRVTADGVHLVVGATSYVDEIDHSASVILGGLTGAFNLTGALLAAYLSKLRSIMLFVLSVSAALGILVSLLLVRRLHRGVNQLSVAAQALDRGDLDYRIASTGKDELGQLAKTLNQMATSLQENMISRAEWESSFNAIPELVFLLDGEGRITSMNRAAVEFLGKPEQALRGLSYQELPSHTSHPPPFRSFDHMLVSGEHSEDEWHDELTGQDWLVTSYPLRGDEEQIVGGVHLVRNVTPLKEAERELAQTSRFLHDVLEAAPLAIAVVDRSGCFSYVNPQVHKEFGYHPQDLVGQHYSVLYAIAEERQQVLAELRQHGEVQSRRLLLRHQDGHQCPARLSVRKLIDSHGQVIGSVSLSRNVSVEEDLQRQLEQAQKLEAIATMAGGLAHNFNNLLMIILGLTNLILTQIDEANPVRTELDEIVSQVQAGSDLTRQLLALARRAPSEVRPINLNYLIRQTADIFARTHKEILLNMQLAGDLAAIEADPGQMQQVLMNLLVNARQAMPEGGKIILKTTNVMLNWDDGLPSGVKPGSFVCLTVRDNGIGMDQETLKHIFEPFFTTKDSGQGTGLGLATVYSIVKKHQGVIRVNSQKNQGTVFDLYFPATQRAAEETGTNERKIVHGQGTILLVDDEPVLRKVAARLLERLGYQVLQAADGARALEIFKDKGHLIDLVMLDLIMPGLSGHQTYHCMKALDPSVRVLFSSGYGELESLGQTHHLAFIQKPYTVEVLSQKVAAVLNPQNTPPPIEVSVS